MKMNEFFADTGFQSLTHYGEELCGDHGPAGGWVEYRVRDLQSPAAGYADYTYCRDHRAGGYRRNRICHIIDHAFPVDK